MPPEERRLQVTESDITGLSMFNVRNIGRSQTPSGSLELNLNF